MDPQAALEQQALEELRRGDLKAAHRTLSVLLQHRPDDMALQRRIQQVEHLVQQRESRIQAEPLRYAHAYIQAGRLAEGLQLLRSALARDPQNQRLRELALEVARRLKDQVQAGGPLTPGAGQAARAPGSSPAAPPMQGFGPAPGQAAPGARGPGSSPASAPVPFTPAFSGAPYAGAPQAPPPRAPPPKATGVDPALEARARQEVALRREAEERTRKEAAEKAKREGEERARRDAEVQARQEAEEKAKREAAEKARREAELRAKKEADAKREAEERVRREAERAREAADRAKREAEERVRREAEREAEERRQRTEQERREAEMRAAKKEQALRTALSARAPAGAAKPANPVATLERWLTRINDRRRPRH